MMKRVVKKVLSHWENEGVGARVRRSIGRPELKNLDPFLLLDELSGRPPAGFPDHPHRGFETVSYLLSGNIRHEDFMGNKGDLGAGDVQWMTAGRGVVHSEMLHGDEVTHGLQLWVNLSKKDKMIAPSYQELPAEKIPTAAKDGVKVKVIAGESLEAKGEDVVEEFHTAVLSEDEELLVVFNKSDAPCHFVLISGQPIREPVFQRGPFVMNSQEEVEQAFSDYRSCSNGFESAKTWREIKRRELGKGRKRNGGGGDGGGDDDDDDKKGMTSSLRHHHHHR
ncbi:hypothetical protein HELRODRAFT_193693 [Helobdella robusta]|uniref:Pirin n=1 Tax=Helobdella robusta TaxID=6412 RepID=T1FV96_HELRO|nr:hypothetical protein HELRODRAFT_193693 [Helobdella robusta]ESN94993.1 hypothetical protein HELRODRAFT_193693 [Helobdella robusta]